VNDEVIEEVFSFGEWVRLRRRALDLSQEELAQRVAYSVATIRKIESDGQRPSRDLAQKLAEPLRLAPDERETFVQVARGTLRVARLPPPNLDALVPPRRTPAAPAPRPPCPYPGMVPFSEYTSELFFGREAEVQDLVARLHLHPFLALIGPSGSGKSSLVFAGLIPALRRSTLFGEGEWLVRTMRPGSTPLAALAEAIENDAAALLARTAHARLLLVVDQFEEVFAAAPPDAAQFQGAVLALVAQPGCYVALTVRADFYPDLMLAPLWPLIQRQRAEVVPLDARGLRAAIAQPAQAVGVNVEPALAERLVADAAGEPGVLPIVQETLRLLWDRLDARSLPLAAYEAIVLPGAGARAGLHVVLARRADAALAALDPAGQAIARRVFLRLVQFGAGRADTRRQQSLDALRAHADDTQSFERTVLHLADQRLLTLSGAQGGARHADIAHETLITSWPTLQTWLAERREAELERRRLESKAAEWLRLGRGANGLLDDLELAEAERWLSGPDALELGYEEALPALAQASRDALLAAEQARAEAQAAALAQAQALARAQARALLNLRALVVLLSVLVLASATVLARPQWLRQQAIWASPTVAVAVPDGRATIGSNDAFAAPPSRPARTVALPPFAIDAHEVSNAQFCMCREAGGCGNDPAYAAQQVCEAAIADLPVTNVTLPQASQFCGWLGRRLPTEVEWEWAARGPDGRRFPTGDSPPIPGAVNLGASSGGGASQPVASLPADRTPDGVADMAGNVQEWTSSLYLPYTQPGALAATWPAPGDASQKPAPAVVRGGSFYATADGADATRRYPLLANQAYGYLGFRCLDGVPLEQLRSTIGAQ
jgi:formylglycine-generating enzyme required for sulfatase activity/transcriptional regulator with XRE-family HTH domain